MFVSGNGDGWRTSPTCIGYSEIDKYASAIYQKHFRQPRTKEEIDNDLDVVKTIVSENNYDIMEVCYVNNVKSETSFIKTTNQPVKTALESTSLSGVREILKGAGQQGENITLCEDSECSICMGEDVSVVENLKKCSLPLNIKTEMDTLNENNMELAICINSPSKNIDQTDTKSCATTVITLKEDIIYAHIKKTKPHKNWGDITKINADELPDFDLLVGGFPCQTFSIAGKRAGFEDTRGTMFFELARIAKAKVPMFMLFENVKGLVSHDKGKTLEVILETLQELGYYTNYEIHNSKDHGVPQNRERIFFLCKHIKGLTNVGQSQKMTTYDRIIEEFLFQLLLNNLVEVKKLQGLASKDSILGYLLLREIKEKLPNPDISESIMGGISTLTEENISQLKAEEVWQNIDMCLKNIWVYDSNELSRYTTSTAIRQIIESKTYTYSRMFQAISLATVLLRDSQKNLWNEMLSSLIVIQENTKYARVNNENEETIITESGTAHIKSELQDVRQHFALGHLRGTTRPEVFPFRTSNEEYIRETDIEGCASTLTGRSAGGQNRRGNYIVGTLRTHKDGNGFREIKSGVAPTIPARAREDGSGQPVMFDGLSIRRLTPTECERLQSFPDGWTDSVSDTQRYKTLGNAVTVNVVKAIMSKILTPTPITNEDNNKQV